MTVQSPTRWREVELRFEAQMTDAEALMWNVEKDPWMNPSGAVVTVLDRPIDVEVFKNRLRWAVSAVPRLRERVVPSVGRLAPPQWRTDPEFNFDYHVRHISLPAPGSQRQLLDLAMNLYEDPYDRTRPLWMFVLIDGLEDGRGALFSKMHHTITDGLGAVYLAEFYMEPERDAPEPPEVDLAAVISEALDAEAEEIDDVDVDDPTAQVAAQVRTVGGSLGHIARRQAGLARRMLGEAAMWGADPVRPFEQAQSLVENLQEILDEMFGRDQDERGGSPLWTKRSRNRHLEVLQVDLDEALNASRRLGGKLNDLLLTVIAEAARDYHRRENTPVDLLNASFVISTRDKSGVGGNNFTPTRIQLPTHKTTLDRRFTAIHDMVTEKKEAVSGSGALANLATVASRLPTSVITRAARQQAAGIDVATSNFPAAPFTVYMSGAKLEENFPIGPLAGTACNITAMSYDGTLYLGIVSDPAAITDPAGWRDDLAAALARSIEA